MLYNNKKETINVSIGNKVIQSIYKGSILIWQAIRSCFGSGFWINEKPWVNDEPWKN
jgi:hypothetical protein